MSEPHHEHQEFEVESQQPHNGALVLWGFVVALVFFGTGAVISTVFYRIADELIAQGLSVPNPELVQLRAQEKERLSTYGWATADKSAVHIPIDRAMELMVEEAAAPR